MTATLLPCVLMQVLAVDRLIPKADAALLARQRRTAAGRLHPVSRIHRVDDRTAMLVSG